MDFGGTVAKTDFICIEGGVILLPDVSLLTIPSPSALILVATKTNLDFRLELVVARWMVVLVG